MMQERLCRCADGTVHERGLVVIGWSAQFQQMRSAGVAGDVEVVPDGIESRLLVREERP
jgi:hypothetical protein